MSPYLFVLAMLVFTGLMRLMESEGQFQYHWRCAKEKISHHCFADDLMLFCRVEETSIARIGECLDQFCSLSGLRAKLDKSSMFLSGVPAGRKANLLSILGYSVGELPVRYLGVPLITSKLRGSHCQVLVDRITDKASSWKCRALSYAGRLQLIKSVLFSIQVYWSSMFILPKVVIRKVEAILRAFLWKGSDLSPGGV